MFCLWSFTLLEFLYAYKPLKGNHSDRDVTSININKREVNHMPQEYIWGLIDKEMWNVCSSLYPNNVHEDVYVYWSDLVSISFRISEWNFIFINSFYFVKWVERKLNFGYYWLVNIWCVSKIIQVFVTTSQKNIIIIYW